MNFEKAVRHAMAELVCSHGALVAYADDPWPILSSAASSAWNNTPDDQKREIEDAWWRFINAIRGVDEPII